MFSCITKFFSNYKKQLAVTPGYYEQQMHHYCKLSQTQEVIALLENEAQEINLLYENGLFFQLAISNDNIHILSALLTAAEKSTNQMQYLQVKTILENLTQHSYISLSVQDILSKHIDIHNNVDHMLREISMRFENVSHEYQNNDFTLLQDGKNVIMILPLTEDNLNISTSKYWQEAHQCYENKTDFKSALDMIDDWKDLKHSRCHKAMIIYNYLVHSNDVSYVENRINDDCLTKIYLWEVASIDTILDNHNISMLIHGYYLYKDHEDDDDSENHSSYHHPTIDSEGAVDPHLQQWELSGSSDYNENDL